MKNGALHREEKLIEIILDLVIREKRHKRRGRGRELIHFKMRKIIGE